MFIDYVPLMLVNMAAGLVILAAWFWRGQTQPNPKAWAPAFAMVGLVALGTGLHMAMTWPIPKLEAVNLRWANGAWGDMSVLLGVLFLGAAAVIAKDWSLLPVTVYGLIASLVAAFVGVRIMILGLSNTPTLTGIGFLLTALGGLLSFPVVRWPTVRLLRRLVSLALLLAAAIWAFIGIMGYWKHLESFSR